MSDKEDAEMQRGVAINIYYEGVDGPVERLYLEKGEEHTAEVSGKQTIEVVEIDER